MKSFKLGPACRLETEVPVWDSQMEVWRQHRLAKPRLIENQPLQLDEDQKGYLKIYRDLLVDCIKTSAAAQRAQDALDGFKILYGIK